MVINRKKNAIFGTFWGGLQKTVIIVFSFIIRTVFIHTIGVSYLGLSSFFESLLQVLNLAELGVSSALVFSMYKPIVDDDEEKICALMNLYRRCYRIIGLIILGLGLAIMPFIPLLIKNSVPSDINIYAVYLMYLGATVLSYWMFAYRNSLFYAFQRIDVLNIISSTVSLVTYILQLVCLIRFRNYYAFLVISILSAIAINVITGFASKKTYPQFIATGVLPQEERNEIFRKVKDLFTLKIGDVAFHSADSIVISSFLGLDVLAVYQNYNTILLTIISFFAVFYNACEAGIANSLIVNDERENRKLLYNIRHISFFFLNFCVTSLVCLYQPFMELWVGKEYLLEFSMVVLFATYLVAEIAPRTLMVFKNAGGIWHGDRFRPLIISVSNLCINIILVNIIGIKGVLIATIFTWTCIGSPWLIYNVNHNLLRIEVKKYIMTSAIYVITMIGCAVVSYGLCSLIHIDNLIANIIIRGLLCLALPNGMFCLFFLKKTEQQYFVTTALSIIKGMRHGLSNK